MVEDSRKATLWPELGVHLHTRKEEVVARLVGVRILGRGAGALSGELHKRE